MYVVGMAVFRRFSCKNDFGSGLEKGGGRQKKGKRWGWVSSRWRLTCDWVVGLRKLNCSEAARMNLAACRERLSPWDCKTLRIVDGKAGWKNKNSIHPCQ
jgi:hypothetical protein